MADLIKILPENVANQIAAGEVVQRPASMVKELMENAVDAGAANISVQVRDGGKSLVQVIDDGKGMSARDAVLAFARHATSKIRKSNDLFTLHTFGFRGEALASIASVAEVELRTRREEDEVGTGVLIAGGTGEDARTESVSCPKGTGITVRNLFFNTPARRKFLKSDTTETKQIMAEFQRVALCNPDKAFTLVADEKTLLNLIPGTLHQRIVGLVGKRIGNQLLDVEVDTPIVKLTGYIGLPATAKKGTGEQFFFVNGRYFRSNYLQKGVVSGYNKLLPFGYTPSYFIYIEVDPSRIDVNIHPQKTEVKFEDEQAMWQIIASAVARSLGKHNVVPMLDFDNKATGLHIPVFQKKPAYSAGVGMPTREPAAGFKKAGEYNPFKTYDRQEWTASSGEGNRGSTPFDAEKVPFIERIPPGLVEIETEENVRSSAGEVDFAANYGVTGVAVTKEEENYEEMVSSMAGAESSLQELDVRAEPNAAAGNGENRKSLAVPGGRYVITTTADGMVVIDRGRAMFRITYEELLQRLGTGEEDGREPGLTMVGQRELFPEKIELSAADHFLLTEHTEELTAMGFDLRDMGGHTVVVYSLPAEMAAGVRPQDAVEDLLAQIRQEGNSLRDNHKERLAAALARSCYFGKRGKSALGTTLQQAEADALVKRLFACEEPNYTPDGKPVMIVVGMTEVEKRLKKR